MNITQFCNKYGVKATADYADRNPHMDDMVPGSSHWRVTLRRKGSRKQLTVPFSMGPALIGQPEADSVLDCLVSDAAGLDGSRSFEEWCGDYGYDTDSRRAERTYKAVEKQSRKLRNFLGELYDEAVEAERL